MRQLLGVKADKWEVEAMAEAKSNKADTELLMRDVDIMHKQMTHVAVLLIEIFKLLEEKKAAKYLLEQAVTVCRWVHEFDPQHLNNQDLTLPQALKDMEEYSL